MQFKFCKWLMICKLPRSILLSNSNLSERKFCWERSTILKSTNIYFLSSQFAKLYQIIQLGHMDCIIQHWSIHPWYPKAISTFSFPRCSNPFSLIPIRSQKTYFQNLRYPRLGQWRNRGLNYSKLEYPEYPKPIQSVRPDMCHLNHRQGLR